MTTLSIMLCCALGISAILGFQVAIIWADYIHARDWLRHHHRRLQQLAEEDNHG